MAMDKLWAPWRVKYIRAKKSKHCLFCIPAKDRNRNFVVFTTRHSLCMLNIFPYNNGHLMVSPLRHCSDLEQLSDTELLDLIKTVNQAKKLLSRVLKPQGYNIGVNLSSVAGAGITAHLHVHIVPRWKGDTNFMPVIYQTKVVSQSLKELLKLLKNARAVCN